MKRGTFRHLSFETREAAARASLLSDQTTAMYSQFQASYQRVEASLQRLTDSIAAYNPSTSAADELVAADDAVQENVETRTYKYKFI